MIKRLKKAAVYRLLDLYKRRVRNRHATRASTAFYLGVAEKMLKQAKYGFLITQGESPWSSARLVQPIPEADFVIWIGTSPTLRKVREISQNECVTLAFQDTRAAANLVLYGRARLVDEIEARRRYWLESWRLFFPGGPEGDDFLLLRMESERIELMNFTQSVVPEPFGLRPAVLLKKEGAWELLSAPDAL